tara:strand:+ start:436 stop:1368 length:933 start_codon:yes stop_codon:yes gene_type:complete
MNLLKIAKRTYNTIKKLNIWTKVLVIIGILLIILMITSREIKQVEAFTQREKFVSKRGDAIYDEFYSDIYDYLVYDKSKNEFEIEELRRIIKRRGELLDVGCGVGHHVKLFNKEGYKAEGLDKSKWMIEKAKEKYPDCKFKNGDVIESITYPKNKFTTITCLYFTIYYIKDKKSMLTNCFDWLKPGGYFVLHLVNRDKFDPILNVSDPLHLVSAQKYSKERLTKSLVKFKDFQYKANFELDKSKNQATFEETLTDDASKNVRQNTHILHMDTQKNILSMAKGAGFILKGKIDMVSAQYQYQYLYILYKPS